MDWEVGNEVSFALWGEYVTGVITGFTEFPPSYVGCPQFITAHVMVGEEEWSVNVDNLRAIPQTT